MLKAILIDIVPPNMTKEEADYRLEEAENLVRTFGGLVLVKKVQKKILPSYKTFVGSGKIDEIKKDALELGANILIVNNELRPMQTYNLGEMLREVKMEVWDRIDLILKIFQKHATTREAKLEIELASIRHMGPRIYGMGMQLTRQGGGIGTRGAGETNLETMKRHLSKHEDRIKQELEDCQRVRKLHREGRRRKNLQTVGIIGYTNAGKSSLLNALTRKGAYAADKLFATLDTRVGKLYFEDKVEVAGGQDVGGQDEGLAAESAEYVYKRPEFKQALISDTIGFIQDLPTTLIKSFQSTLEETIEADLLLHVIDVSDPKMENKMEVVHDVLRQIGAGDKPMIYVFNKLDLLEGKLQNMTESSDLQVPNRTPAAIKKEVEKFKKFLAKKFKGYKPCFVSTVTLEGIPQLKDEIREMI